MCGILINGLILIALIKVLGNREVDMLTACVLAFFASIGGYALFYGLAIGMGLGLIGLILAAALTAGGVGLAVSSLFGVEMNRSLLIGGIFMAVNIGVSIMLQVMMRPAAGS